MSIRTIDFAIAAAMLAIGTAAHAGVKTSPPIANTTSIQPKVEKRYCVTDVMTGSRVPRKLCKTRAEWLTLGFDPLEPNK